MEWLNVLFVGDCMVDCLANERIFNFITYHYFGTWYLNTCKENEMSVELLSVCQLIIKALQGLHEISKHIAFIMYNILYM